MNGRLAAALLDPARRAPHGLAVLDGSPLERRFDVHRNNVVASLVDALAQSCPVLQALVGETFFRAMAAEFVRRHPPRHPVLALYGDELPAFVERFAPARWLPYLADVARLELARGRALNAADAAALAPASVVQALARRGDGLRLRWHPSLQVLRSRHAVVSLWAAHQHAGDDAVAGALAAVDTAEAEEALTLRDAGDRVLTWRLARGAASFVETLADGRDLATAVDAASREDPGFDAGATLQPLLAHGAVVAVPENDR